MNKSKLLAASVLLGWAALTTAADHRDGPLTTGDPSADINDVYTFVNPRDPTELIIATTIFPAAAQGTRFSDAVEFRIHVDNGTGDAVISCRVSNDGATIACANANSSLSVSGRVGEVLRNGDFRLFAGLRDDPFFFDLDAFNATRTAVAPRFTNPGNNFFRTLNTMVITMGIKSARLTNNGANPIVKIYSSSHRLSGNGISPGHSGMWYDPANSGHGFVFQALAAGTSGSSSPRQLVVYWAVYDNSGNQLNLFGLGNIANDRVSVPLVSYVGGRFPPTSSSGRTEQAFGTVDITFTGCNTATANVQPTRAGFSATTLSLTRLTPVEGLPCTFYSSGQIDRMGRPGINTALIDLLASTGKKDAYNRAEALTDWTQFQSEMQSNLTALDRLDGVTGNTLLPPATAAAVFVDDRLQVNTSAAACGPYLAVELNVSGQCGGRTLDRDVIDDTLGAVVGPGVSDNVGNDSTFLADFPFLAAPQQ